MTLPDNKSLRQKLQEYVEAAYLHGLPIENLDTGELEPPADIKDVEWIVDSILSLIKARLEREAVTLTPDQHIGGRLVKAVPLESISEVLGGNNG